MVKRIREKALRSKVILMTAYETPEVKTEARRLEVDRYVKKPFDLTALSTAVVILLSVAVGAAETRRRREQALLGNLAVSPTSLALLFAVPAAVGEGLLDGVVAMVS